ncbi:MAG: hypothetical protein Q8L11_04590 [Candidatus Moranbacteria bacterium]|nr:hypothetical protein [Candidatus Moranbacteria bacterium]
METLAYVVFGSFLAIGINMGWSWWIISLVAVVGVGLIVWALDADEWLRPFVTIAISIVIVLAAPPSWRYINDHLPLAVSLAGHRWMAIDTKVSVATTSPAVVAKAAALTAQTVREDEAAAEVARLFKAGKTQEALDLIQKLSAEGKKVRAVISGDEPPTPATPTKTKVPAKATTPPVKKAAKVAAVVPVVVVPTTIKVGAMSTSTAPPAAPETWNVRYYRGGQLREDNFQVVRTGADILMSASDGTKLTGKLSATGYSGKVFVRDKYAGVFGISLSEQSGSGWWHDTQTTQLTWRRVN